MMPEESTTTKRPGLRGSARQRRGKVLRERCARHHAFAAAEHARELRRRRLEVEVGEPLVAGDVRLAAQHELQHERGAEAEEEERDERGDEVAQRAFGEHDPRPAGRTERQPERTLFEEQSFELRLGQRLPPPVRLRPRSLTLARSPPVRTNHGSLLIRKWNDLSSMVSEGAPKLRFGSVTRQVRSHSGGRVIHRGRRLGSCLYRHAGESRHPLKRLDSGQAHHGIPACAGMTRDFGPFTPRRGSGRRSRRRRARGRHRP